jgi:integrase
LKPAVLSDEDRSPLGKRQERRLRSQQQTELNPPSSSERQAQPSRTASTREAERRFARSNPPASKPTIKVLSASPLRHTFAASALDAGFDVFELARLMGTSVAMIDRTYGHLAKGHAERARERLNRRPSISGPAEAEAAPGDG